MDEKSQYRRAMEVLREGGVVAMPTDTVYGVIAVAGDAGAVERVYDVKRRDPAQPMPAFVADVEQARLVAELNITADRLAERFWPGPLTIALPLKPTFRTRAAAGGDSIGLRVPDDPVLREMAAQLGPLTGTSANIAGREECRTAAEVRAQLGDALDFIVDAPAPSDGVPSTVVDCTDPSVVRVVREGGVSREALTQAVAGLATVS